MSKKVIIATLAAIMFCIAGGCAFTPDAGKGAYRYVYFTEAVNAEAGFVNDDDCIKVSELSTTPYDTFTKESIYNDTGKDVTIGYMSDGSSEMQTTTMPKDALWDLSWVFYKDLTIVE